MEACGICHTDAATVTGVYPGLTLPRVPGHKVVGPALKPSVAECLNGKSVNGLVSACSDRVNPGALWLSARGIKRKLVRTKGVF